MPTIIPTRALVVGFFIICNLLVEALMLLTEIVDDVVNTLRRPDLRDFVITRVRQQVKLLHAVDNFPRDKVEQTLTLQNPDNLVRTALPAYLRKFDMILPITDDGVPIRLPTDGVDWRGFREVDPRKTMGFNSREDTDYYFVAGDALNIKMSVVATKLYVSYYKYPDTSSMNTTTWITENFPELVTYRVLMICHRMLGNFEQSTAVEQLFEEARSIFLVDALTAGAN